MTSILIWENLVPKVESLWTQTSSPWHYKRTCQTFARPVRHTCGSQKFRVHGLQHSISNSRRSSISRHEQKGNKHRYPRGGPREMVRIPRSLVLHSIPHLAGSEMSLKVLTVVKCDDEQEISVHYVWYGILHPARRSSVWGQYEIDSRSGFHASRALGLISQATFRPTTLRRVRVEGTESHSQKTMASPEEAATRRSLQIQLHYLIGKQEMTIKLSWYWTQNPWSWFLKPRLRKRSRIFLWSRSVLGIMDHIGLPLMWWWNEFSRFEVIYGTPMKGNTNER